MDNVCHTLAGAALAESGLARRTALGYATLLVAANLPDLDVLSFIGGPAASLEWRRGWTHGVVALAVLPVALTVVVVLLDLLFRKLSDAVLASEVRPGQILLLAYAGVLSHPLLDLLNTYGVRWMVPWSQRWSYGDALFIVDPWLILILGLGVWASRARRLARQRTVVPERPARLAIGVAAAYIAMMLASSAAARRDAAQEMQALHPAAVRTAMAGPVLFNPFRREIVIEQADAYRTATFRWLRTPHLDPASVDSFPVTDPGSPAVAAAMATADGRRFLGWARFPVLLPDSGANGRLVHIVDLRYARSPDARFGAVTVDTRKHENTNP